MFDITPGTKDEILRKIIREVKNGKVIITATPNLEMWALARKDKEFLRVLQKADIRICDGAGLKLIFNFFHQSNVSRYTGWELSMDLLDKAKEFDWKVLLIGGKQGIAKKVAKKLQISNRKLQIKGMLGYAKVISATKEDHQRVITEIKKFRPQVLLAAFGHGKQEKWMLRMKKEFDWGIAMVGVGGVLDQIVDSSLRPPKILEKIGFAWLYRLARQPWRVGRLTKIIFCVDRS